MTIYIYSLYQNLMNKMEKSLSLPETRPYNSNQRLCVTSCIPGSLIVPDHPNKHSFASIDVDGACGWHDLHLNLCGQPYQWLNTAQLHRASGRARTFSSTGASIKWLSGEAVALKRHVSRKQKHDQGSAPQLSTEI